MFVFYVSQRLHIAEENLVDFYLVPLDNLYVVNKV